MARDRKPHRWTFHQLSPWARACAEKHLDLPDVFIAAHWCKSSYPGVLESTVCPRLRLSHLQPCAATQRLPLRRFFYLKFKTSVLSTGFLRLFCPPFLVNPLVRQNIWASPSLLIKSRIKSSLCHVSSQIRWVSRSPSSLSGIERAGYPPPTAAWRHVWFVWTDSASLALQYGSVMNHCNLHNLQRKWCHRLLKTSSPALITIAGKSLVKIKLVLILRFCWALNKTNFWSSGYVKAWPCQRR